MDSMLRDLRQSLRGDVAVVDLSQLTFMRPVHMVGVAARAHRARSSGQRFELVSPRSRDPGSYAARMGLNATLDSLGAAHDLPRVVAHPHRDLLEVSSIASPGDVRTLAALVHRKVRNVDPQLAGALFESLGELGANVWEHSGTVGFIAAQTMPGLNELRFAVADSGHGLRATLSDRGARDDGEAIGLALDGVSRFADPDRGGGLRQTAALVHQLNGFVYVASGTASVRETGSGRAADNCAHPFTGTLIEAVIPLSRGKHARPLR